MWSIDENSGILQDVYIKNIDVITEDGRIPQGSKVFVRDQGNKIKGIFIENIAVNGAKQKFESLKLSVDSKISNVICDNIKIV